MTGAFAPIARQLLVWCWVHRFQRSRGGVAPTVREIMAGTRIRSFGQLYDTLGRLEHRGVIRRMPHRARALEVIVPPPESRAPDGAPLYFIPVSRLGANW